MISRLEVRGKHWFFQKVLRDYLDAMDIDSAETVLDMGCLISQDSPLYGNWESR